MIKRFLLIAAAVALIGAGRPPTETELGSHVPHAKRAELRDGSFSKEDMGRIVLRDFARCIFARSPAKVAAALMLPAGADGQALKNVVTNECLETGIIQFTPELFRGALFAEMYRRHDELGAKAWIYPISGIDFTKGLAVADSEDAKVNFIMLVITDCVYAKNAAAMRAVVLKPVASKAQEAAFAATIKELGPCVPVGTSLRLNRSTLEIAFSEYLYRSLVPVTSVVPGKPN